MTQPHQPQIPYIARGEVIDPPTGGKNQPGLTLGLSVLAAIFGNTCFTVWFCVVLVVVPILANIAMLLYSRALLVSYNDYEDNWNSYYGYVGADRFTIRRKNWLIGAMIASGIGLLAGILQLMIFIGMKITGAV